MLNFILYILSFLAVISSSYFICSILKDKKFENTLIYYVLIIISQIIITFEGLSIIKQINITGVLISNIIIFVASLGLWNHYKRPAINIPDFKHFKDKVKCALKKDKVLRILFYFFLFSGLVSLFLALIAPTNSGDSLEYHLARIGFWIQQGSLAHYETSSIRQLIFPINSEILILWSMIFLKGDYLAQMPEYLSYTGCLFILYNFMAYQKISTRRTLWTIFILASLPAVILESMSCQTNLIIAFLLLTSLYLFVFGIKEKDKKSIIFSAISYAIAIGTKTTAFLFLPAFAVVYCFICLNEIKTHSMSKYNFYRPLLLFAASIIPAFILLGLYNYVLNYIDYGNPFSPVSFIQQNNPYFTIKGFLTNIIKYLILFFDFSGINAARILNPFIMGFKDSLFYLLGLKTADGLAFNDLHGINTIIHENYSTFGILGFILFLPLIIKACLTKIRFQKNRSFIFALTGLIFMGFLLVISAVMGFCMWSNRYFVSAVMLSTPVFMFSYTRQNKAWKIIIALIAIVNFMAIPVNNVSKPLFPVLSFLSHSTNIRDFRNEIRLKLSNNIHLKPPASKMVEYLGKVAPDNSKIAFIATSIEERFYQFFEENPTWKIYPLRYDLLFKRKNYNDYDFIIIPEKEQLMTVPFKGKIKYNYTIADKKIVYNQININEPLIIYSDKNEKPINSGIPVTMSILINLSDIPPNFKFLKAFSSIYKDSDNNFKDITYYIYQKK